MGTTYTIAPHLKKRSHSTKQKCAAWGAATFALTAAAFTLSTARAHAAITPAPRLALTVNHLPPSLPYSQMKGLTDTDQTIGFELALMPRNAARIPVLMKRLKDPKDPLFGKYLTPDQYRAQFGRTPAEMEQITAFAKRHNFNLIEVKKNNLLVRMSGKVSDVNSAFGITLRNYVSTDPLQNGRIFHSPSTQPLIDSDIAPMVRGVLGLANSAVPHPFSKINGDFHPAVAKTYKQELAQRAAAESVNTPFSITGTGNGNFFSPDDATNVYQEGNLQSAGITGTGQVMGLAELGTFTPDDIGEYENYYGLPDVPLYGYSVDDYDYQDAIPGETAGEIELDIDMFLIWGYGASRYEIFMATDQPSSEDEADTEFIDIFADMATASPLPNVISVSYGESELQLPEADILAEGETAEQLALQGQTVCVASGDAGAYTTQPTTSEQPNVSIPASIPSVVAVGGTLLNDSQRTANGEPYEVYSSETSWFDSSDKGRGKIGTGSGGGVSQFWALPDYQYESFDPNVNTQGSTTMRNVPDVSLFGDYDQPVGYSVYLTTYNSDGSIDQQGWNSENGTSAASPLFAGLLACTNQIRVSNKLPMLGEANPDIYYVAESSQYGTDFHDIHDNSTNGYYHAVTGYDEATGWGSPNNAAQLAEDLGAAPTYIAWVLSASSASVTSGKTLTGAITLPLDASQADKFSLKSSSSVLSIPTSTTVAKGKNSENFTITAGNVTSATKVTLTATFFGYSESITLTVNPASSSGTPLSSLTVSPTSVVGGSANSTGTVKLTATAPSAGTVVALKSSNTNVATVPSSVTVSSGHETATFAITSKAVTASTNVTITATSGGVSKTATVTVTPASSGASLSSVTLASSSVTGGTATSGTINLSSGAPSSGAKVTLTSSDTSVATVPSSETVASGSTSHGFSISTSSVTSAKTVTITASYNGTSKTATLTVKPASSGVALSTLTLSPTSVKGGASSTGTVKLTAVAPSGGTKVTLSTSNTSSSNVPSSVTVASGHETATFTVETASVFSDTTAKITASAGGATKTATLTITK